MPARRRILYVRGSPQGGGAELDDRSEAQRADGVVVRRSERDLVGLCREAKRGRHHAPPVHRASPRTRAVGPHGGRPRRRLWRRRHPVRPGHWQGRADGRDQAGRRIVFYNWTDYIDPAIKRQFKAKTGIEVKEIDDSGCEEVLAKLRAGAKGY